MQPWGPSPTKALCDNDPKGTEPHTRAIGIQSREHRQGRRQVIGWGGGGGDKISCLCVARRARTRGCSRA